MAEYVFTTAETLDGEVRIEWAKDGKADPLNFWIIPPEKVEDAKARVREGEFD